MNIEPLESRIAPASLTFGDVDGDNVIITISKGDVNDIAGAILLSPFQGLGQQLRQLDLTTAPAGTFDGASITITATPNSDHAGDGYVNVGYIKATGIDLGAVTIDGDLAKLGAGDATLTTSGVKSLSVVSLGRFGTTTGAPDVFTAIQGPLGSLKIAHDMVGGVSAGVVGSAKVGGSMLGSLFGSAGLGPVTIGGDFSGYLQAAKLAGVTIGGSLLGKGSGGTINSSGDVGLVKIAGDFRAESNTGASINVGGKLAGVSIGRSFIGAIGTGAISSVGDMGPVKIGGDFREETSGGGQIYCGANLASVSIGGSVIGDAPNSAKITSVGNMGPVKIGGDLIGGGGDNSGQIKSGGKLASVTIRGSILGGEGSFSGHLFSTGDMGAVKIGGDLRGGSPANGGNPLPVGSGYIEGARIASIFIGGSIITGFDFNAGQASSKNASIRAHDDIGSLTVKGSLVGNSNGDDVPVIISARGHRGVSATSKTDVAIGKITIGGRVDFAIIEAGYDVDLIGINADAQVGTVTVGSDWISSNLLAGVRDAGDGFGNSSDVKISGGGVKDNADASGAISTIASVIIKGHAIGTTAAGDFLTFGIEAQQLGTVKVGGATVALRAGAGNDVMSPGNVANKARHLGATLGTTISDDFDFHAFEIALI